MVRPDLRGEIRHCAPAAIAGPRGLAHNGLGHAKTPIARLRKACNNGAMPFRRLSGFAWLVAVVCCLFPLITVLGQTGIPLSVELRATAIPSNSLGTVICGRLWLNGTNLFYRFASLRTPSPVELTGPSTPNTNGPLLFVLNPFNSSVSAYSECDAASGFPGSPPPWQPLVHVAEGMVGIAHEQIPQLLTGQLYADAVVERRMGHVNVLVAVRGQILLLDSDGDGVPDFLDHCSHTPTGSLVNSQGCALEQLCPCEGAWQNHGDYVNSLNRVLKEFLREGLLRREEVQALFQAGAQSDCGKRVP